ncbi:hypothetical protein BH11PAT2_BH11PAT2_03480 [soil metagenome]
MPWNLTYRTDPKSVGAPDRTTVIQAMSAAAAFKEFFLEAAEHAGENIPDQTWDFCHYRSDSKEWFEVHLLEEAGNWKLYRHLGHITLGASTDLELRKQAEVAVYGYIQQERYGEYHEICRLTESLPQREARNVARDVFLEVNKPHSAD